MFRTLTTRQRVGDIVGAGLFFLFFALIVLGIGAAQSGWAAACDVLVLAVYSVALAFRRLSPPLALGVAWAGAILQMGALRDVQFGNLAILAVLYAVGCYGNRVVRWLGLASAGLGALLAALYLMVWLPGAQGTGPADLATGAFLFTLFASFAVLALPWMLGMLASARRLSRESKQQQVEAQREAERAEYAVVVEQERNRIARDMHDVVAHSLAVVIAQADGARYAAQGNPELAATSLGTIAATAREALADVRLLLAQLRHSEAEGPQPTIHDLERLIEQLRATGLRVEVSSTGTVVPMSAGHQIAVFRIVQEALTNALRHGDTSRPVGLSLRWADNGVRVTLSNPVRTGAAEPAPGSLGHGIPGMRERALLTGGSFTAGGTGAGRFEVSAWIPSGAAQHQLQQQPEGTP
ncbi:sensor histidine kinase [Microterricola viridarii]|uniref:histidine kinase n=1 Tax=Microterricola viridarii TaxID=412690 RepID=A0A1H1VP94_9MICO|nr:sensor histidine kinase [Microterricola viridarii]SDS86697.1 Signal transduction histidine kinase [Microterricola viridarii]